MRTFCDEPLKLLPDCPDAEIKAEQFRLAYAQSKFKVIPSDGASVESNFTDAMTDVVIALHKCQWSSPMNSAFTGAPGSLCANPNLTLIGTRLPVCQALILPLIGARFPERICSGRATNGDNGSSPRSEQATLCVTISSRNHRHTERRGGRCRGDEASGVHRAGASFDRSVSPQLYRDVPDRVSGRVEESHRGIQGSGSTKGRLRHGCGPSPSRDCVGRERR